MYIYIYIYIYMCVCKICIYVKRADNINEITCPWCVCARAVVGLVCCHRVRSAGHGVWALLRRAGPRHRFLVFREHGAINRGEA